MFNKLLNSSQRNTLSPEGIILLVIFSLCFVFYTAITPLRIPSQVNLFFLVFALHSSLGLFLWFRHRENLNTSHVITIFIASRIALFPMFPWLSDDAFAYYFYGKASLLGFNLYTVPANDSSLQGIHDAAYSMMAFKEFPNVYPPFTTMMTMLGAWISSFFGSTLFAQIYGWKIVVLLFESIALWMVMRYYTFKNKINPALLYVLIPLSGIECIGQSHNDILLLPFLALLFVIVQKYETKNTMYSTILTGIITAFLLVIKITPAILFLPLLLKNVKWDYWLISLTSMSITIVLLSFPFFGNVLQGDNSAFYGFTKVLQYYNGTYFNSPPLYIIRWFLELIDVHEWWLIAPKVLTVIRVIATLSIAWYLIKIKTLPIAKVMYWIFLASILISPKVHTWYFVPALFIASILAEESIIPVAILMTFSYAIYSFNPPFESFVIEWILWLIMLWLMYRKNIGKLHILDTFQKKSSS